MTHELLLLTAWLGSGLTALALGLAAVGLAKRRLAVLPAAEPEAVPA